MHDHYQAFLRSAAAAFRPEGPVYRIGCSADQAATSGEVRDCFSNQSFIGCELYQPNRATAGRFAPLPFPPNSARTILSLDVFDHLEDTRPLVAEMSRVLAPGGLLLVSCAMGVPNPASAYQGQVLPMRHFDSLLPGLTVSVVAWQGREEDPHTAYAIAHQPPLPADLTEKSGLFIRSFQRQTEEESRRQRWLQRARTVADWLFGRLPGPAVDDEFFRLSFALSLPRVNRNAVPPPHLSPSTKTGGRLDLTDS